MDGRWMVDSRKDVMFLDVWMDGSNDGCMDG
jgi:hypothetical protein